MKTEERVRRRISELYSEVAENNMDKEYALAKISVLEWVLDP
jgi:hypothetical protein